MRGDATQSNNIQMPASDSRAAARCRASDARATLTQTCGCCCFTRHGGGREATRPTNAHSVTTFQRRGWDDTDTPSGTLPLQLSTPLAAELSRATHDSIITPVKASRNPTRKASNPAWNTRAIRTAPDSERCEVTYGGATVSMECTRRRRDNTGTLCSVARAL